MTTEQKTTLIERFNQVGEAPMWWAKKNPGEPFPKERGSMTGELGRLLSAEIQSGGWYDRTPNPELLAEYRQHFDWDETYSVRLYWHVEVDTTYSEEQCDSSDELRECLSGKKEFDTPPYEDMDVCYSFEYVDHTVPEVRVSNLRLKQEPEEQESYKYLVYLYVETDSPADDGQIGGSINSLFDSDSGYKVLSSKEEEITDEDFLFTIHPGLATAAK